MKQALSLFAGFGIEIEYMIVDIKKLNVDPICDKLIHAVAGSFDSDVLRGPIAWSNELALHVIELKTNGPTPKLEGVAQHFQSEINDINDILRNFGGQLLPTGAHPWMDPNTEAKLWQHEHSPIYEAYNRIFDCRGHGWTNLQSTHLNLPFANDEEFGRLHTAIRLILPILPALSASTPIIAGKPTGMIDTRLEYYRSNQKAVPEIAGKVIPECVLSKDEYENTILAATYRAIAKHDPEGILQEEWLNSRGAIARFERDAIEIRIIDNQECPKADLSIVAAVVSLLKALVAEKWQSFKSQQTWDVDRLADLFLKVIKQGQAAVISDTEYLAAFGYNVQSATVKELWQHIVKHTMPENNEFKEALELILTHGNLSERILKAYQVNPNQENLSAIYRELAHCLAQGKLYIPHA